MRRQTIVIVGAGAAGLTCALACAAAGAQVTVLEALPVAYSCPAHVDVRGSLLRDLAGLGLAHEMVRRGFVYNGFSLVDEDGVEALRVPTPRLAGDQLPPALGVSHDDFIGVIEAAARSAGAEIRRGTRVHEVHAQDGTVVTECGERVHGDLVVLAVGARSSLVSSLMEAPVDSTPRPSWVHTLIVRPEGVDKPIWMVGRSGRQLLVVPIGMCRAGLAVQADVALASGSIGLASTLQQWGGFARRIACAVDPDVPLAVRAMAGALMPFPWYRYAVLCAGASAHAIAPPFGQSAAQGVEDAVVLGELVRAGLDRPALLQRFMERRGERAARIHALTSRAAQWMAKPDPYADFALLGEQIHSLVAEPV